MLLTRVHLVQIMHDLRYGCLKIRVICHVGGNTVPLAISVSAVGIITGSGRGQAMEQSLGSDFVFKFSLNPLRFSLMTETDKKKWLEPKAEQF